MCAAGLEQHHPPPQVHKNSNNNNGTNNGSINDVSSSSSEQSSRRLQSRASERPSKDGLPSSSSSSSSSSSTSSSSSSSHLQLSRTDEMMRSPSSPSQQHDPRSVLPVPTTTAARSALPAPPRTHAHHPHRLVRRQTSLSEAGWHATTGSLASAAVLLFSCYFPFLLAPWAATRTYRPARWQYDPAHSVFCNSAWTYGTDYLLAAAMFWLARRITAHRPASRTLALRSRGLLACYCCSVLAGGLAHQFYHSLDDRNTWHFRVLWTVCVGCVTAASAWMGSLGTELAHIDRTVDGGIAATRGLPLVPEWFWGAFGACATLACAAGAMSFQRPACDIFIAGITQFPSTFYVMLLLGVGLPTIPVPKWTRLAGVVGFILNAPLLPLYPLLVQYTDWTTASINTLLHGWLFAAWGLQGLALHRVEQALAQHASSPPCAVPVPRTATGSGSCKED